MANCKGRGYGTDMKFYINTHNIYIYILQEKLLHFIIGYSQTKSFWSGINVFLDQVSQALLFKNCVVIVVVSILWEY